jgi:hypothetical protein
MNDFYLEIHDHRIDLFLCREFPVLSWPRGQTMKWERFSFPIRCLDKVQALALELEDEPLRERRDLVRAARRAILWAK